MRHSKLFLIGIGLLVALVSSGVAQAQSIVGTKHDLSGAGYGSTQICIFCHTPHNANGNTIAPLWNHQTTTATYELYSGSSTLDATMVQPAGVSKACLSCHDGTVAVDSYGTRGGTVSIGTLGTPTGHALLGTDLSNDHPISFTYDTVLVSTDAGLNSPSSISPLKLFGTLGDQLECASCHSVHNDVNGKFLRLSNAASALCLKCHDK